MKKDITLWSQSRELFTIRVRQNTKNEHLNLSDLQSAYDIARVEYGWIHRDVNHVINFKNNTDRIFYILKKQGLINCSLEQFTEQTEKQGTARTLKSLGVYKTTGRGQNRTTTCNPYIWMIVAMEMNPLLYAEVISWLTDRLLLNRIEAGDFYKGLSKAVSRFTDVDYASLAKALNIIVFGRHESGIRNSGTELELAELLRLEQNLTYSIESGFIRSFDELMSHLRSVWHKKQKEVSALQ